MKPITIKLYNYISAFSLKKLWFLFPCKDCIDFECELYCENKITLTKPEDIDIYVKWKLDQL